MTDVRKVGFEPTDSGLLRPALYHFATRALLCVRRVGVEPTTGVNPPVSKTGALPFCYPRVYPSRAAAPIRPRCTQDRRRVRALRWPGWDRTIESLRIREVP